ncbi:MAG: MATE family efflux transporter [Candidatus Sumerlaeia bacterium]|nr:MATE family efflux transporter [Candidatus Sumerlaeia bacterium]
MTASPATAASPDLSVPSGRRMLGTVARLGAPSVLENFLSSAIILTDALMLARLENNTVFLAATALTGVCFWRIVNVFGCTQTGAGAYVSRRWGEERHEDASRALGHTMALGAILGLAAAALVWAFVPALFSMMGARDEVLRVSVTYFRILLLVMPVRLALLSMTACMRAAGDTRTPLLLMALMVVSNLVLNWLLIFGKLGFPRLEMDGAALASAASFVLGTSVGALLLRRGLRPRRLIARNVGTPIVYDPKTGDEEAAANLVPDPSAHAGVLAIKRGMLRPWLPGVTPTILRISRPALGEEMLYSVSFITYLAMVGHFGAHVLAAHSATVRIESLSFTAGWGVAVATGTMVGQALGAGQLGLARRLFSFNISLSMIAMGLLGIVFVSFPDFLLGLFRLSGESRDVGRMILYVLGFAQVPMAAAMCMQGGLRGAGDTLSPFLTQFAGVIGMRLGVGYLLTWPLGFGVMGIYYATALDWVTRALFLWWFLARGRWERIKV